MYIVIELQTNNGACTTLTYQFTELNEAYAKFYDILRYAATSDVDVHSAVILTEAGGVVRSEHFEHSEG